MPEATSAPRVPLSPVLLVNFIGTMGFSIVLPFLVFIVTRFGGNAFIYGVVGATYPLFQFVGAPVLGRWSDRFGRRRILLLSQAGTLGSWVLFAAALYLPVTELAEVRSPLLGEFTVTVPLLVLLAARALDGLTGGNISVANAYVADLSTDADRNRNFGRMAVAANMGLILGPALAGALGATAYAETLPVLAATGISAVAVVLIAIVLPESNPCGVLPPAAREGAGGAFGQEPVDCTRAAALAGTPKGAALRQPGVALVLALNFGVLLAFNFFYTAFPAHAVGGLGWSVADTGVFFAVLSALMVLVQGPVLGWLSRRVSEPPLVIAGCFVLGANFLFMMADHTGLIYAGAVLFALGNGLMWPSLVSVVASVGGAQHQGAVQGLAGSAGSLAAVVGLIGGGIAFALVGVGTFAASAALAFGSGALAFALLRGTRQPGATA